MDAYTLVTWATPLLVELWVERQNLQRRRRAGSRAGVAVVAVFGGPFEDPGGFGFADLLAHRSHSQILLC